MLKRSLLTATDSKTADLTKRRVLIYDHGLFYVLNGAHFSIDVPFECHDPAEAAMMAERLLSDTREFLFKDVGSNC